MRAASHFQSVGKFLYTQNPFYLISCGLLLYGIQFFAADNMPLESRCWILAGAMAGYTLLMAITAIAVIRLGKVWQDARSILLIVIIGLLGLSVSFDQLCISNWRLAVILLSACAAFAFVVSESIFLSCGIRFRFFYRLPYYSILLAFFAVPVVAGYAIDHEYHVLKNWMAVIFSFAVAAGLVLMSPAIRRGASYVVGNGTPWKWPLYPLSAFLVLIVLAAVRSHAIWMSFSTLSGPIAFEPLLLTPFVFAIAWLLIEHDGRSETRTLSYVVMALIPLALVTGITNNGLTRLPIAVELQYTFGSAFGLIAALICLFYATIWLRGMNSAGYFLAGASICAVIALPMPDMLQELGVRQWMIAATSSAVLFGICLVKRNSDWAWLVTASFISLTCLLAARSHGYYEILIPSAGGVMIVSAMLIGAIFRTKLAEVLRISSAIVLGISAVVLAVYQVLDTNPASSIAVLAVAALPLGYLLFVRRRGWIWVAANNVAWSGLSFALVSHELWTVAFEQRSQLAIPFGIVCFVLAVTITSAKTGALDRSRERLKSMFRLRSFQVGL